MPAGSDQECSGSAPRTRPRSTLAERVSRRSRLAPSIEGLSIGDVDGRYLDREANRTRGARPSWATFLGGAGLFTPGEARAIVELEPGSHALVCFAPGESGAPYLLESDHHAHPFVVRPRPQDAPRPPAPERDVTLTMHDYSFELSQPLEAGRQMIHVENAGIEPHHASSTCPKLSIAARRTLTAPVPKGYSYRA